MIAWCRISHAMLKNRQFCCAIKNFKIGMEPASVSWQEIKYLHQKRYKCHEQSSGSLPKVYLGVFAGIFEKILKIVFFAKRSHFYELF